MNGAAHYIAVYRKNPHLFARDYLHLELRLFQKILLIMMNVCTSTVMIGARGIGKTFLCAVFCVTRCILYPGTKICIASGKRGQAIQVLEKVVHELMQRSPELRAEINMRMTHINGSDAAVAFINGSYMKVVTASDTARGNRCNILIIDEFRMVSKDVIDAVLKKFLTQRRMPPYSALSSDDRKKCYADEKNMTLYLSSAYYQDHWSYTQCLDTFKAMVNPNRHRFLCGLPYQLSIVEGLLDPDVVRDEMADSDFSEIKHAMEYEAKFWGSVDGSFFEYADVSKDRKIQFPMLPRSLSSMLKDDSHIAIKDKQPGEKRILSADIALMASTRFKNDATSIHITQLMPSKAGRYTVNLLYSDTNEGLRTEEEALRIRRMYDEYQCDYLALDTKNVGLSIFDCLSREMTDVERGEVYPALSCCNNAEFASRCADQDAPKVIWAIVGSAKFNSDCAVMLREGFRAGRIRLLINEYDGEEAMSEIKGFGQLSPEQKLSLMMPYINTTLLINELVNLNHDESNGILRLYESKGMRKDRYSSLSYNYYVAMQLEKEAMRSDARQIDSQIGSFVFRAPKVY